MEMTGVAGSPSAVVRRRHLGRWISAGLVLVVALSLLASLAGNPNLQLGLVRDYLFSGPILKGVLVTLELTALSMVIGMIGAVGLALMRLSDNPVMVSISVIFIWFFRGTPILVQLLFWGYLGAFYSDLTFGLPFTELNLVEQPTESLITPFVAAVLGLSLNEAAYSSEIVRSGIISVDEGQRQAAKALGFTPVQTMRKIVLPQAMRVIIPPVGNATILMLKTTSLVSVIGGLDLLTRAQAIYQQNFQVIPLLVVVSIWYLLMTSVLSVGQHFLEKRFARGSSSKAKDLKETARATEGGAR